jgi:hypothetical protein
MEPREALLMLCINIPGMGTRLLCLISSPVKKLAFDDIQKLPSKDVGLTRSMITTGLVERLVRLSVSL